MKTKTPKYIMLHHSAVSRTLNADQWEANNRYHRDKWDFCSLLGFYLAYNYEISSRGRVRQARADGERTAACYQRAMNNGQCIHVCLDGNFDEEKPTAAQIYALRDLLRSLAGKYGLGKEAIVFHRDFARKTCPGKNVDKKFVQGLL